MASVFSDLTASQCTAQQLVGLLVSARNIADSFLGDDPGQENERPKYFYIIVDVRDDDREAEGWIQGSYHLPSETLSNSSMNTMKHFITHVLCPNLLFHLSSIMNSSEPVSEHPLAVLVPVFHCQFSQVRGPSAQARFQQCLQRCLQEVNNDDDSPASCVLNMMRSGAVVVAPKLLSGGFGTFRSAIGRQRPELIVTNSR